LELNPYPVILVDQIEHLVSTESPISVSSEASNSTFLISFSDTVLLSGKLEVIRNMEQELIVNIVSNWGNIKMAYGVNKMIKKWEPGTCRQLVLPGFATENNWQKLINNDWWELLPLSENQN
jgi:hypothetical protein